MRGLTQPIQEGKSRAGDQRMEFPGNQDIARKLIHPKTRIDVHTHILPCFKDDGPKSLEEAIILARQIKDRGADAIIWTPHYGFPRLPHITWEAIETHYQEYAPLIERQSNLTVLMGSELYITPKLPKNLIPLGDTDWILFETPLDQQPECLLDAIDEIIARGFRPIFAHVERYCWLEPIGGGSTGIECNEAIFNALIDRQVEFQINYSTVLLLESVPWIKKLLRDGVIRFLGSDKHVLDDGREPIRFLS